MKKRDQRKPKRKATKGRINPASAEKTHEPLIPHVDMTLDEALRHAMNVDPKKERQPV